MICKGSLFYLTNDTGYFTSTRFKRRSASVFLVEITYVRVTIYLKPYVCSQAVLPPNLRLMWVKLCTTYLPPILRVPRT